MSGPWSDPLSLHQLPGSAAVGNADQAMCFFCIQQALPGGTPLLVMKQCRAQPVAPELLFMLLNSGAGSGLANLAPSQTWQEARRDAYGVCLTKRVTNIKYISINILFLVATSEKTGIAVHCVKKQNRGKNYHHHNRKTIPQPPPRTMLTIMTFIYSINYHFQLCCSCSSQGQDRHTPRCIMHVPSRGLWNELMLPRLNSGRL